MTPYQCRLIRGQLLSGVRSQQQDEHQCDERGKNQLSEHGRTLLCAASAMPKALEARRVTVQVALYPVSLCIATLSARFRAYPELFAAIGPKVPDLRGQFLRGIRDGYTLGQKVGNTLGRHNHTQPVHTHSFSGQLASTALSGTAAGQSFNDTKAGISRSPIQDGTHKVVTSADNAYVGYLFADSVRNKAESSSVTGRLDNGRVNGTIASGGGDPTDYTGDDETAPDHLYVHYLIRARQMPLP